MKVLVPFDGSASAKTGLRHALESLRGVAGTEIHVLNVQPRLSRHSTRFLARSSVSLGLSERAEPVLSAARREIGSAGVKSTVVMRTGAPAEEIVRYAQEQGISRIVVGAARKSALMRVLTGSIADALLERSPVPVELVPGGRPGVFARYGLPASLGAGLTALVVAVD